MIFSDYHVHTSFSADCKTDIEELIIKAKQLGMKSICFTDHNDKDFPDTPEGLLFDLEIDEYIDSLSELRRQHSEDGGIDIRIGVEQGVMPSTCEVLDSYSKDHPGIDFIICSSHVVNGYDPYYPEYFEACPDEKTAYRQYFETILYNVTHFNDYNVYGHLDYILRYGPTKADNFDVRDYMELFEVIFKNIIEKGKGIEINTGSLYRGMDFMHPHIGLLRMYRDMGGEIITVGSDTHDVKHLGYAFDSARKLLISEGFKYICEFKAMKPQFITIE